MQIKDEAGKIFSVDTFPCKINPHHSTFQGFCDLSPTKMQKRREIIVEAILVDDAKTVLSFNQYKIDVFPEIHPSQEESLVILGSKDPKIEDVCQSLQIPFTYENKFEPAKKY